MAESGRDGGISIPWPAVLTILAIVGGVYSFQSILTSSRPQGQARQGLDHGHGDSVDARLWQDPLAVVQAHLDTRRDGRGKDAQEKQSVAGQPSEQPAATQPATGSRPEPHTIGALETAIKEAVEAQHSPFVLAVMVEGGPYPEDAEARLRARNAVLSGLAVAGFVPMDAEHVDYVHMPWAESGTAEVTESIAKLKLPPRFAIPFEWCELVPAHRRAAQSADRTGGAGRVLVLWLDEDFFQDHALVRLDLVLEVVAPSGGGKPPVPAAVIGPRSSTTLAKMRAEARTLGGDRLPHLRCVEILSPTTTADDELLSYRANLPSEQRAGKGATQPSTQPAPWETRFGKQFQRTIGNDSALARALVEELRRRGINPKVDRIALVGEWDTFYARAAFYSFTAAATGRSLRDLLDHTASWPHTISRHNYLRGIDGRIPGAEVEGGEQNAPKGNDVDTWMRLLRGRTGLERAEGHDQSDYLRRLAGELAQLDREFRWDDAEVADLDTEAVSRVRPHPVTRKGIRAIGILGTDPYDKLLVLQALRGRFPETVFFTTDLDERLVHPVHWKFNHNLVVASHFGGKPHFDEAAALPAFRDGYQTSLFCATVSALLDVDGATPLALRSAPPRLFEVGRSGAVDITPSPARPFAWWNPYWWKWTVAACVVWAGLLLLLIRFRQPLWYWNVVLTTPSAVVLAVLVVAVWLGWLAYRVDRADEPLVFSQGLSVWPTEAVRLLAVLLSLHFLAKGLYDLERCDRVLAREYGLPETRLTWHQWLRLHPLPWFRHRPDARSKSEQALRAGMLWARYRREADWRSRALRVAAASLLYALGGAFLMNAFGRPYVPYRGTLSRDMDVFLLRASVALLIVLTFFVIDATRLSERFAGKLCERTRWPPAKLKEAARRRGLAPSDLDEYLDIRLLGEQTEVVGRLIYFPFIILTILILSRNLYFDNWSWPFFLVVIFTINSVLALVCAVVLRRAAERARRADLSPLKAKLARLEGRQHPQAQERAAKLKLLVEEISATRRGAFARLSDHPALHALLLPSGGLAVYVLMDLFAR